LKGKAERKVTITPSRECTPKAKKSMEFSNGQRVTNNLSMRGASTLKVTSKAKVHMLAF
jgi:hypothetical protein